MPEFSTGSTIHDVLRECRQGRDLLYKHGYDVGDGFVDVLSQYGSLQDAAREGRLRDLRTLVAELNRACGTADGRSTDPPGAAPSASGRVPDGGEPSRLVTVVGLFVSHEEAERAIGTLMQDGFSPDQIGYLEPGDVRTTRNPAEGAFKGIVLGAVGGAILGALIAATADGIVAGFGSVLLGGATVPMLIGAALVGSILAVAGGLFGAEAKSEDELYFIEEAQSGRVLVSVEVRGRTAEKRAIELLRGCHALEVSSLGTARFHARLRHPELHARSDAG